MNLPDIRDKSFSELSAYLQSIGEKPFRADQVFDWLYHKGVDDLDQMKNLPPALKDLLKKDFQIFKPRVVTQLVSEDGTTKCLFELHDGQKIETVLIPAYDRSTVCVSSQAGCKFGCRFCASGIGGWKRNLAPSEILDQVMHMRAVSMKPSAVGRELKPLSNIVFMGVGEPLDNYENLLQAIRIINDPKGLNIGARKITISTCGVIPRIQQLAKEGIQLELAISLHGYNNQSRNVLMPVNRKYPFNDLIAACQEFFRATKRQITFEYILIKGVTCTDEAAGELSRHLKGMVCKMNLIPYNPVKEFDHQPPSRQEAFRFRQHLEDHGIHATIRMPRGRDVSAACGQLRHQMSDVVPKAHSS